MEQTSFFNQSQSVEPQQLLDLVDIKAKGFSCDEYVDLIEKEDTQKLGERLTIVASNNGNTLDFYKIPNGDEPMIYHTIYKYKDKVLDKLCFPNTVHEYEDYMQSIVTLNPSTNLYLINGDYKDSMRLSFGDYKSQTTSISETFQAKKNRLEHIATYSNEVSIINFENLKLWNWFWLVIWEKVKISVVIFIID